MTFKICKWLFLLLVISLPLVRPFNTVIFGLQVPFTDFIFLAVGALFLISLIKRETELKFTAFYYFIGLYGLALTVSTIFSAAPHRSFFKLLGVFYLFSLAVLAFHFVQDKLYCRKIVFAWLLGTSLTVLASLAGFTLFYSGFKTPADNYLLSHFGSLPAGNYPRIHALFANANMMCNFLNVGLMMAVLAEKAGWLKVFWAKTIQIGVWFAAIFTFSPGIGGMILSFGIWHWAISGASKKHLFARLSLAAAVIAAVLVFGSTLVSPDTSNSARNFSVPLTNGKIEPSVRVLVWENSLQTFVQYPFTGKGTGTDAAALQYRTLNGTNQVLLDAHNVWLNILGQTGLVGLAAFTLFALYLFGRTRFNFVEQNRENLVRLSLSCAFIGAFLYQGLSGSFEDARHLWILFGMLVGISAISKTGISQASPAP